MNVVGKSPSAHVFFDGQNLFHAVKEAWGYTAPNFDAESLAHVVCSRLGWAPTQIRFYTGVPASRDDPMWHQFWDAKTAQMGRRGIVVFKRDLRTREFKWVDSEGNESTQQMYVEKGVDVRIALDVVRAVRLQSCDAILIFSQDQDFTEAVTDVKQIAAEQVRFVHLASAFPVGSGTINTRGIDGTDWQTIDDATYRSCIDTTNYFPKRL